MDLIVARDKLALWIDQRRAVGRTFGNLVDVSHQYISIGLLRDLFNTGAKIRIVFQIERGRRFGPDDQSSTSRWRGGNAREIVQQPLSGLRFVPRMIDINVRLDQPYIE